MNNKFYLIFIILIVIASGVGYWSYNQGLDLAPDSQRQACLESGGKVNQANCCKTVGDFPGQCAIGACGCSPENSHRVRICDCGPDECFNGTECVKRSDFSSEVNFEEEGNLIQSDKEKKWILVYEEPGKPALTAELHFVEGSVCDLEQGQKPCVEYESYGEAGDRVKVVGNEKDGVVEVSKLIYVE